MSQKLQPQPGDGQKRGNAIASGLTWLEQHRWAAAAWALCALIASSVLVPVLLQLFFDSDEYLRIKETKPIGKLLEAIEWLWSGTISVPVWCLAALVALGGWAWLWISRRVKSETWGMQLEPIDIDIFKAIAMGGNETTRKHLAEEFGFNRERCTHHLERLLDAKLIQQGPWLHWVGGTIPPPDPEFPRLWLTKRGRAMAIRHGFI